MNLSKIYEEEDLFPRQITDCEKRDYGYLFYNEENKDSYDSNHALIYKGKVDDLLKVIGDIIAFYKAKGINPSIYQSILDEGYFKEVQNQLLDFGFESWEEEQKYMVLSEKNQLKENPEVTVQKISVWKDIYATEIFEAAGEPWEIEVAKNALKNSNTLFFVAFYKDKPVGMTYAHVTEDVCRVNYLLVAKEYRNKGVGRALINSFVEYCKENNIENCFLWPDGETAEKIYYEAGFRIVETKRAGRASYK